MALRLPASPATPPLTMQQIMQSMMSSFSNCELVVRPNSAWMRRLLSEISPRKALRIFFSRATFSWMRCSPASSQISVVVRGSWLASRAGFRQCGLTRSLPRSQWEWQSLPSGSSSGQVTLRWLSRRGRRTAWQSSFQSLSPLMIWWAESSKSSVRVSTPLPARTFRQARKQQWVKLATSVRNFSYSRANSPSLLNSWASMQCAQIVPMANSNAFRRHSFTAYAYTSPKERYFSEPQRYFSRVSRSWTFPRSSPDRPSRNSCSLPRMPMQSSEQTCLSTSSRQSSSPSKVSRFSRERSTEELRLENSILEKAGGAGEGVSRREWVLGRRGESLGEGWVGVELPMFSFCIINQLHSWGSFITEPPHGAAVSHWKSCAGGGERGSRTDQARGMKSAISIILLMPLRFV